MTTRLLRFAPVLVVLAWPAAAALADDAEDKAARAESGVAATPLAAPDPRADRFDGAWLLRIRPTVQLRDADYPVAVANRRFEALFKNNGWRMRLTGQIVGRELIARAEAVRSGSALAFKFRAVYDGEKFAASGLGSGLHRAPFDMAFELLPDPKAEPARPDAPALAVQAPPTSLQAAPAYESAAADTAAPRVTLPNTLETERPEVTITGRIEDPSGVTAVTIDGRPVDVDDDGWIRERREVPPGESVLSVVAVDGAGNRARHNILVVRTQAATKSVARARDLEPPDIALPDELETTEPIVEFEGTVTDASDVVDVLVAGRSVPFDESGGFTVRRGVAPGPNEIRVSAFDEWGNRADRVLVVIRRAADEVADLDVDFGRFHALVIGNNAYSHLPRLQTAIADAEAVAETLERDYGYTVTMLRDADRYAITSAISNLRRQLTASDNLLIYYAGHGVVDQEADAGFWLPIDAEPDSEANWIANSFLTRNLKAMTAKHVLVVADSCYSGTLVRAAPTTLRSGEARDKWLRRISTKRARTALTSGGLEPVLDGGGGRHSVFAKAFLDVLRYNEDVMEATAVFSALRRPVVVNSAQTPEYSDIRNAGHDGGDFLFVRR